MDADAVHRDDGTDNTDGFRTAYPSGGTEVQHGAAEAETCSGILHESQDER